MEQLEFFNKIKETKPICPVCGNTFEKSKFARKHIYCSQKCLQRDYYQKNKNHILIKQQKYKKNNKEKCRMYDLKYKKNNKEKIKISKRKSYHKNPKKHMESSLKSLKKRLVKDENYKIQHKLKKNLSRRIRHIIKNSGGKKFCKSMDLLGCTIQEAKEHLEKQFKEGMTWDNHGNYGWHIDHIIPCASFDLTDPEQQKKCFHYTNLQPLWANENMSKGAKIL